MRDQFGLLPPTIKHNYERSEMVDRQVRAASALYHALQDLDEKLDVEFVTDRADPEYGVVPGRWHVVRRNDPPAPDSYIPITHSDGSYREPDFGVVEEMRRRDLWREMPSYERKPHVAKPDEGRVEELAHDIRAGARVAGDGGLTKRKWGKG